MPRDGAIIFGDLVGKLDTVRIECPKCGPRASARLAQWKFRTGRKRAGLRSSASPPLRLAMSAFGGKADIGRN